jgi:hypothetical protein
VNRQCAVLVTAAVVRVARLGFLATRSLAAMNFCGKFRRPRNELELRPFFSGR